MSKFERAMRIIQGRFNKANKGVAYMEIDCDESDYYYIVAYVTYRGYTSRYIFDNQKELSQWVKQVIME